MKKLFVITTLIALLATTAVSAFDVFYGQSNGDYKDTGISYVGFRSENSTVGYWHYGVFYADADNSAGIRVVRYISGNVVANDYFKAGGGFSEPIAFDSMVIVPNSVADTFTWRGHKYN